MALFSKVELCSLIPSLTLFIEIEFIQNPSFIGRIIESFDQFCRLSLLQDLRNPISYICPQRNFQKISYTFSPFHTHRSYIQNRFSIFESNIFTICVVTRANNPRKINIVNEKKLKK